MKRIGLTYVLLTLVLAGFLLLPPAQAEAQKIHWTRIEAVHSKKCMDVKGNSKSDRAPVRQYRCKRKGPNQRWQIVSAGGGYYYFVNRNSGKCLDIRSASTKDGAMLQQYSCKGGSNQKFKLNAQSSGYQMVAQHSGRCLEVKGGSRSDRSPIQQGGCSGSSNQAWRMRGIPK